MSLFGSQFHRDPFTLVEKILRLVKYNFSVQVMKLKKCADILVVD